MDNASFIDNGNPASKSLIKSLQVILDSNIRFDTSSTEHYDVTINPVTKKLFQTAPGKVFHPEFFCLATTPPQTLFQLLNLESVGKLWK